VFEDLPEPFGPVVIRFLKGTQACPAKVGLVPGIARARRRERIAAIAVAMRITISLLRNNERFDIACSTQKVKLQGHEPFVRR